LPNGGLGLCVLTRANNRPCEITFESTATPTDNCYIDISISSKRRKRLLSKKGAGIFRYFPHLNALTQTCNILRTISFVVLHLNIGSM